MTLTIHRRPAANGRPDGALVLLHGYGADGPDLLGLADVLAPHLPGLQFLAPDGPEPCRGNPFGRQWFPIPWLDGSGPVEMAASLARSTALLHGLLDRLTSEEGLAPARTFLLGFSQGTMMALHAGPERAAMLGGIVGFSGRLMQPERLAGAGSRPPVFLAHGDADQMVPFASMAEAAEALAGAGFEVATHAEAGMGHGIGPQGLGLALAHIRRWLGLAGEGA